MWLLPFLSTVSSVAASIYYRLTITGTRIPKRGPVLLVANHPNSLLDPMLVVAGARRPVRFLAKAPLFSDFMVGWLIRAAGAIPVHRRQDGPPMGGQNEDMFRAVFHGLSQGAAVGVFPEGVSHSEPSLEDIKTGAARIAMGTRAATGVTVSIVPVGVVLRHKDVFRSEATVVLGTAIAWSDLAERGVENRSAVRELTERIEDALRDVTVNLDAWEDEPLVACAEAIWQAEYGGPGDEASRIRRLRIATEQLARLRRNNDHEWQRIVENISTHNRRLDVLRLTPQDLETRTGGERRFRRLARRFYLLGLPAAILAMIGGVVFWVPFRLTGTIAGSDRIPLDRRSTYKLLIGAALYTVWITALAICAGLLSTPLIGLLLGLSLPIAGIVGVTIRERWKGAWSYVRRYLTLESRHALIANLRERQRRIAEQLSDVYERS